MMRQPGSSVGVSVRASIGAAGGVAAGTTAGAVAETSVRVPAGTPVEASVGVGRGDVHPGRGRGSRMLEDKETHGQEAHGMC